MTESEWLACRDPKKMVDFLRFPRSRGSRDLKQWQEFRTILSERKLRLFACACCRRIGPWLSERAQRTLDITESVADAQLPDTERSKALRILSISITRRWGTRLPENPEASPEQAVQCAASRAPGIAAWATPLYCADTATRKVRKTPKHRAAPIPRKRESEAQAQLVRDVFGNPFRSRIFDVSWRTPVVTGLAQAIYQERAFDRMPILADALEDAGCTNQDILNHCRQEGVHVRGCWVVDLVLGKS